MAFGQDGSFYVAVDKRAIFWTNHSAAGKTVMLFTFDDAKATIFAADQYNPTFIAADDRAVYWTNLKVGDGTVMAKPKVGGPLQVLAKRQLGPSALVVDDRLVYWTGLDLRNRTPRRLAPRSFILSVPKVGGKPSVCRGRWALLGSGC